MWMILQAALAADPTLYPLTADVTAPAVGVSKIVVPPEMIPGGVQLDTLSLTLRGAAGTDVPFAIVQATPGELVPLDVIPLPDGSWRLASRTRPFDRIEVTLPTEPSAATVTITDEAGNPLRPPERIWRLVQGSRTSISLPVAVTGAAVVTVDLDSSRPLGEPDFDAWTGSGPEPVYRKFPVVGSQWTEGGWRRYEVDLGVPLPVTAVILDPAQEVFRRQVLVTAGFAMDHEGAVDLGYSGGGTTIRRQRLGGGRIDDTRVPVDMRVGDRVEVQIEGPELLDMADVTVEMPGLWIVVQDPGAGPFTLYGGSASAQPDPWDIQFAATEILRLSGAPIVTGAVAENPAYEPPEVRSDLAGPGPVYALRRQLFARDIQGGPGLVRLPLDAAVVTHARPDLADLRIVDPENRQIPFIVRRKAGSSPIALDFTRKEGGGMSTLEIPLPDPNLPVQVLTLTTDATVFERSVQVMQDRGATLQPIRAWRWTADERPGVLALTIGDRVGDKLYVRIDNGDDPPLPITGVEIGVPSWEIITTVPEGGARLVYGDPRALRAEYDLQLLGDELTRRRTPIATLGEEVVLQKPAAPWFDRLMVAGGIGALALGLLVMIFGLLRATPAAPPPEEPTAPPAPPTPAPEPA